MTEVRLNAATLALLKHFDRSGDGEIDDGDARAFNERVAKPGVKTLLTGLGVDDRVIAQLQFQAGDPSAVDPKIVLPAITTLTFEKAPKWLSGANTRIGGTPQAVGDSGLKMSIVSPAGTIAHDVTLEKKDGKTFVTLPGHGSVLLDADVAGALSIPMMDFLLSHPEMPKAEQVALRDWLASVLDTATAFDIDAALGAIQNGSVDLSARFKDGAKIAQFLFWKITTGTDNWQNTTVRVRDGKMDFLDPQGLRTYFSDGSGAQLKEIDGPLWLDLEDFKVVGMVNPPAGLIVERRIVKGVEKFFVADAGHQPFAMSGGGSYEPGQELSPTQVSKDVYYRALVKVGFTYNDITERLTKKPEDRSASIPTDPAEFMHLFGGGDGDGLISKLDRNQKNRFYATDEGLRYRVAVDNFKPGTVLSLDRRSSVELTGANSRLSALIEGGFNHANVLLEGRDVRLDTVSGAGAVEGNFSGAFRVWGFKDAANQTRGGGFDIIHGEFEEPHVVLPMGDGAIDVNLGGLSFDGTPEQPALSVHYAQANRGATPAVESAFAPHLAKAKAAMGRAGGGAGNLRDVKIQVKAGYQQMVNALASDPDLRATVKAHQEQILKIFSSLKGTFNQGGVAVGMKFIDRLSARDAIKVMGAAFTFIEPARDKLTSVWGSDPVIASLLAEFEATDRAAEGGQVKRQALLGKIGEAVRARPRIMALTSQILLQMGEPVLNQARADLLRKIESDLGNLDPGTKQRLMAAMVMQALQSSTLAQGQPPSGENDLAVVDGKLNAVTVTTEQMRVSQKRANGFGARAMTEVYTKMLGVDEATAQGYVQALRAGEPLPPAAKLPDVMSRDFRDKLAKLVGGAWIKNVTMTGIADGPSFYAKVKATIDAAAARGIEATQNRREPDLFVQQLWALEDHPQVADLVTTLIEMGKRGQPVMLTVDGKTGERIGKENLARLKQAAAQGANIILIPFSGAASPDTDGNHAKWTISLGGKDLGGGPDSELPPRVITGGSNWGPGYFGEWTDTNRVIEGQEAVQHFYNLQIRVVRKSTLSPAEQQRAIRLLEKARDSVPKTPPTDGELLTALSFPDDRDYPAILATMAITMAGGDGPVASTNAYMTGPDPLQLADMHALASGAAVRKTTNSKYSTDEPAVVSVSEAAMYRLFRFAEAAKARNKSSGDLQLSVPGWRPPYIPAMEAYAAFKKRPLQNDSDRLFELRGLARSLGLQKLEGQLAETLRADLATYTERVVTAIKDGLPEGQLRAHLVKVTQETNQKIADLNAAARKDVKATPLEDLRARMEAISDAAADRTIVHAKKKTRGSLASFGSLNEHDRSLVETENVNVYYDPRGAAAAEQRVEDLIAEYRGGLAPPMHRVTGTADSFFGEVPLSVKRIAAEFALFVI